MSYRASALIAPDNSTSLKEVETRLVSFFRNSFAQRVVNTEIRDNKLVLTFEDWSLYISINSEPYVVLESKEMADIFAQNHPEQAVIATCKSRFEISCDPDRNMDHFNDYVLTLEQLSSIPKLYVFEDASQKFQ